MKSLKIFLVLLLSTVLLTSFSVFEKTQAQDSDTKLLIHSDDADGNTTFTDSSDAGHTITPTGDTHHETDVAKFGGSSIHFDGTGDYLTSAANTDWNFTGDFTIDMWVYPQVYNMPLVKSTTTNGWGTATTNDWALLFGADGRFTFYVKGSGFAGDAPAGGSGTVHALNQWVHVTVTRSSDVITLYTNGNANGVANTYSSTIGTTKTLNLGQNESALSTVDAQGYFDEVRISHTARWTANFTPPIRAYAESTIFSEDPYDDTGLILDWRLNEASGTTATDSSASSNDGTLTSFADTSGQDVLDQSGWTAARKKLGSGALKMDSTDDIVTSASNIAISGASARTLEYWAYLWDTSRFAFPGWGTTVSNGQYRPKVFSGNYFLWAFGGNDWATGVAAEAQKWQHHVVTYNGTNVTWYINGESIGTVARTYGTTASPLEIGRSDSSEWYNGIVDAVRVYNRYMDEPEVLENYRLGSILMTDEVGLGVEVADVIALDCGADVDFGTVTPGTPVSASTTCSITTNSESGYSFDVKRNDSDTTMDHTTDDTANIPDITAWSGANSAEYASPGLAFRVYDGPDTGWQTDWDTDTACPHGTSANADYAGFPATFTEIYDYTSYSSTSTSVDICYIVDISSSQKSGSYDGIITYQVYTNP